MKSYLPGAEDLSNAEVGVMAAKWGARGLKFLITGSVGPLGWLGIGVDFFMGFARKAALAELPAQRKEAQREDFRNYMWEKFWTNEAHYDSRADREAAFDKFVGDNTGHNVVPALTQQAELKRQDLIDGIDDRWLEKLDRASELQQRLEEVEKAKPAPDAPPHPKFASPGEFVSQHEVWTWQVEAARKELDSYMGAMAEEAARDVQSVKEFESKPGNWDLTPDQQNMLTNKMEPEASDERSDDDRFYDVVGGRPD